LGHKEDEFLIKDQPSATYEMLLKKAEREGRIGGKFCCPICGMRYKREREASVCCKGIMR
jgi:hypothetical protein